MVLQRDQSIPVWGWANPDELVTVQLASTHASTRADAQGRWRVALPPQVAGGPHTLTVSGSSRCTVADILIGEVWLCSGQSNMEWGLALVDETNSIIAAANHPRLRLLMVPKKSSATPEANIAANWAVCTPTTVIQGGFHGFSAVAYHFACELQAKLNVPVGVICAAVGATRIEPWTPPEGFARVPALADIAAKLRLSQPGTPEHRQALQAVLAAHERWLQSARIALQAGQPPPALPSVPADIWAPDGLQDAAALYNAMIHPLVPFAIRGALWYQGEANHTESAPLYIEKMKALVGGWRQVWQQGDFPFFYVQLAPFRYGREAPEILPTFWEAQAAALQIPNTGMVVVNDLSNVDNIHPRRKTEVGQRLARLALNRTYGASDLIATGPRFRSMQIEGARLRLSFDSIGSGLASRDGKPLTHFEIVDRDQGCFVPATAVIDGDTIVLTAPGVTHPVAMRFAWHKLAEPNLMNREGLPATPFRAGEPPVLNGLVLSEARGFLLVYEFDLAKAGPTIAYDIDNRRQITGEIDRIAYHLELGDGRGQSQYVFVAMNPFTTDLAKIGIPSLASGASFQQQVANLVVASNVPGVTTGARPFGNIEFWPGSYAPTNAAAIPGAAGQVYDFGDTPTTSDGYGCMQVHDYTAKQTLFAFNNWVGSVDCDLGIGNAPTGHPDWTFARNGGTYAVKRLRVLVRCRTAN